MHFRKLLITDIRPEKKGVPSKEHASDFSKVLSEFCFERN